MERSWGFVVWFSTECVAQKIKVDSGRYCIIIFCLFRTIGVSHSVTRFGNISTLLPNLKVFGNF